MIQELNLLKSFWKLKRNRRHSLSALMKWRLGIVHAAQDKGYNVPEDFEVISFDNTRLTLMVRPQITTIVQPLYDIGAVAMRLLTKLMNKEQVEEGHEK